MTEKKLCMPLRSIVTGWDFSTGEVKCLAFDMTGEVLAEVRLPTDLWKGDPADENISELNLLQLEGQARASVRGIVAQLKDSARLNDWVAGGISATHHTGGRIDENFLPIRRAICWNDQTLAAYRERGEERLGGREAVKKLIGGPWADRYTLSHLVKDEDADVENEDDKYLKLADWKRTYRILTHGPLAAGYLTGNFDVTSVSAAASTGMLSFVNRKWKRKMLGALAKSKYRTLAWEQLPKVIDHYEPVGLLGRHVSVEAGVDLKYRPVIYPTSDDQQAGLVGGGAVNDGQMAIILGTSAVVNSSSGKLPDVDDLDVMCLNWGPYLLMRCYSNGAQVLNDAVGANKTWSKKEWTSLEEEARAVPPGSRDVMVMPFPNAEPSLGITNDKKGVRWIRRKGDQWVKTSPPRNRGVRRRASLEAVAYMIALGVESHVKAHRSIGLDIEEITVSGGVGRSDLMCEILASVLGRGLKRLLNEEGPALGAAVTALAAHESNLRRKRRVKTPFTVADAVATMVKYRKPVDSNDAWASVYKDGLAQFKQQLKRLYG
ncbi:MAG: xylulose kinase [Planctomycetes bacterium]|nr:xylulose kinase [Planctomycetota bacterium]MBL7037716.1 xylulose kinase [Pirellulaceae bacterium]